MLGRRSAEPLRARPAGARAARPAAVRRGRRARGPARSPQDRTDLKAAYLKVTIAESAPRLRAARSRCSRRSWRGHARASAPRTGGQRPRVPRPPRVRLPAARALPRGRGRVRARRRRRRRRRMPTSSGSTSRRSSLAKDNDEALTEVRGGARALPGGPGPGRAGGQRPARAGRRRARRVRHRREAAAASRRTTSSVLVRRWPTSTSSAKRLRRRRERAARRRAPSSPRTCASLFQLGAVLERQKKHDDGGGASSAQALERRARLGARPQLPRLHERRPRRAGRRGRCSSSRRRSPSIPRTAPTSTAWAGRSSAWTAWTRPSSSSAAPSTSERQRRGPRPPRRRARRSAAASREARRLLAQGPEGARTTTTSSTARASSGKIREAQAALTDAANRQSDPCRARGPRLALARRAAARRRGCAALRPSPPAAVAAAARAAPLLQRAASASSLRGPELRARTRVLARLPPARRAAHRDPGPRGRAPRRGGGGGDGCWAVLPRRARGLRGAARTRADLEALLGVALAPVGGDGPPGRRASAAACAPIEARWGAALPAPGRAPRCPTAPASTATVDDAEARRRRCPDRPPSTEPPHDGLPHDRRRRGAPRCWGGAVSAGRSLRLPSFAKVNLGLEVLGHARRTATTSCARSSRRSASHDDIVLRPPTARTSRVALRPPRRPARTTPTWRARAARELRAASRGRATGVEITHHQAHPGRRAAWAAAAATPPPSSWASTGCGGSASGPAGLHPLARRLGADVPYFLIGGTALGLGRGDEVYPLWRQVRAHVVIVDPGRPALDRRRLPPARRGFDTPGKRQ